MNPKPLRHVDLYSSAGRLEALYRELQDPAGIAVVCHPLTTGGGTLHNKVVFRTARGLENANIATLRFNFRGAGASGGQYEGGEGEQEDVAAAIEWVKKKHPGKKLFVGGFSFGSWVSTRVAWDRPDVDALFLIGTPVNKYDFGYLQHCEKPMLFVHGTNDEHGNIDRLEKLVQHMRTAESIIITGADHFFQKHLDGLEESVRQWAEGVIEG